MKILYPLFNRIEIKRKKNIFKDVSMYWKFFFRNLHSLLVSEIKFKGKKERLNTKTMAVHRASGTRDPIPYPRLENDDNFVAIRATKVKNNV